MPLIPLNNKNRQALAKRLRTNLSGRSGQLSSGKVAQLESRVQELTNLVQDMASNKRRMQGGEVVGPNRNQGSVLQIRDATYGHGGINDSDIATISGGATQTEDLVIGVSGNDLNRIQDSNLCAVEAAVTDDLAANARDFRVTMYVNGDKVPNFRQVPLRYMIPTLDDEPRFVYPDIQLGASDNPEFYVTPVVPYTAPAGDDQTIRFILTAGNC